MSNESYRGSVNILGQFAANKDTNYRNAIQCNSLHLFDTRVSSSSAAMPLQRRNWYATEIWHALLCHMLQKYAPACLLPVFGLDQCSANYFHLTKILTCQKHYGHTTKFRLTKKRVRKYT